VAKLGSKKLQFQFPASVPRSSFFGPMTMKFDPDIVSRSPDRIAALSQLYLFSLSALTFV
jgi:hypothetical protein